MIHILRTFSFKNGIKSDHKHSIYVSVSLKRPYTAKKGVFKNNINKVISRRGFLIKISH